MLDYALKQIKSRVYPLWVRVKHFQDMFTTAKDVYGRLVGLDLDASSLLAVQLTNSLGIPHISRLGAIGLPGGVISEDVIADNGAVSSAIRKMIQTGRMRTRNIVMAMPGSKVAIKEVKLERWLSDADAEIRAKQEAQRTFPDLAKTLFLDFAQIERPGKNYFLVIVFCRREDILPRVDSVS